MYLQTVIEKKKIIFSFYHSTAPYDTQGLIGRIAEPPRGSGSNSFEEFVKALEDFKRNKYF